MAEMMEAQPWTVPQFWGVLSRLLSLEGQADDGWTTVSVQTVKTIHAARAGSTIVCYVVRVQMLVLGKDARALVLCSLVYSLLFYIVFGG